MKLIIQITSLVISSIALFSGVTNGDVTSFTVAGLLCAFAVGIDEGSWRFTCMKLMNDPFGFLITPVGWQNGTYRLISLIITTLSLLLFALTGSFIVAAYTTTLVGVVSFIILLYLHRLAARFIGINKAKYELLALEKEADKAALNNNDA